MSNTYRTVPYRPKRRDPEDVAASLANEVQQMETRRTVRMFSTQPVPQSVIENAIRIAGTAPSGAHRQPWHFVAISDLAAKRELRRQVEEAEREFYAERITPEWRAALEPLGTDFEKTHITDAPWVLIVFRVDSSISEDGQRLKNYYMTESVGIAVGFLISALHRAGLATLTHTPAPMTFLREFCSRPEYEKPFLILPVGYPAEDCVVPDLVRKPLCEILTFVGQVDPGKIPPGVE